MAKRTVIGDCKMRDLHLMSARRLSRIARRSFGRSAVLCLALLGACQVGQSQVASQPDIQQLKETLRQLEQQLKEVQRQIGTLEGQQNAITAAPQPGAAPAAEAKKPESTGSFDIYGTAMLDSGYQFKQNDPDWFDVVRPTKLPAYKDQFAPDGKTYWGVRQSRFGVKSSNQTSLGELKTIFEFELFGTGVDAGQTTFRLRHAYGELGQFGGGQTNSPFMDGDVFPNSIEYWGPNGMVFFRNVQVRWMPIQGESRITIAAERPGASADQGVYGNRIELEGVRPRFDMPDISWEARLGRRWGYVEIAGIFRKIGWVDTNTDQYNLTDSVLGWGLNLSSNVKFGKNTTGRFQGVYGKGIQNYMNDAPVDVGIQNNFSNPVMPIRGVPLPIFGGVAFVDHNWNERFSSTLGYSMINIWNSNGQESSAFRQGHYGVTNLLFYPVKNVMMGGEFQWGRRLNYRDGFNVNDYRLQFSMKYNFSKLLSY